jgi:hypothetical protein
VVDTVGWQLWQPLLGLSVPEATSAPPMKHSETHAPLPLQTSPAEARHVVVFPPAATFVNAVVDTPGWQVWHELDGLVAPAA